MPQHPFFPLAVPDQNGHLLLTPCPGTLEASLAESLAALKAAGATAVITLMTESEMAKSGVQSLPDQCQEKNLEWLHLPLEDEGAPTDEFACAWRTVRAKVHQRLDYNESVVIHCKGGSGRTGVVAAQILMERGVSIKDAIDQVKALRPNAFTQAVQVYYITQLADKVGDQDNS